MDDKNKTPNSETEREPYEKPEVVSEEVFETLALSCSQANPDDCFLNPNAS